MRFRPATLIAVLALLIAAGGSATAASGLINGKKVKAGTLPGKAFKNQTITRAKLSTSAIAAFAGDTGQKGPEGEKGETGSRGEKGATGDQGAPGLPGTRSLTATATKVAQIPNSEVEQVKMTNLTPDRYVVTAKVNVISQTAGSLVDCSLEANGGTASDNSEWTNTVNSGRGVLWMLSSTEAGVTEIKVVCNSGNSSATLRTSLTAVPTN
ncbi:MAG TPA: collagen-like protein [Solirubrobacterales bacterium]|nr:collagen-like protein [Solirubrobacterales bacterium]